MVPIMSRLYSYTISLSWIWLLAGCVVGSAQAATTLTALVGTWKVTHVEVDEWDQMHWLYRPEDPRLLGREALISSTMISLNNDSHDCLRPSLVPLPKIRLQKFVGQRFPRPPHYGTPTYPTLSNFGLAIADSVVLPLQISCDSEASDWDGSWIVPLSSDRLLTNYDNSGVILVLERHIAPEPIKPSFPCDKARSVAERAICASAALAGYDRSIAAAYQRALKLATGDDLTQLRHEQADWLKTRNACGSDAECLAKSMRNRVDLLMQQ